MQQLSGMDATFLYLETPTVPMHIGALSVLEGSLQFEDFRALLCERIHLVESLRQRLVEVPLGLDRPYWIEDPDFNIDHHLQHIALPKPGGWRQLRRITSRFFSLSLPRSRPLWEMMFVEGLDAIPQVPPGSTAVISKIHHAAIDGMSGADILGLLFDLSPAPRVVRPAEPRDPERLPSNLTLIKRSIQQLIRRPLKLPGLVLETIRSTQEARRATRVERLELPTMPFSAPRTRLNGPVSSNRVWNTALLSLDRVKALKNNLEGITINDVMLATCAGALRRYLLEKDDLPDAPLVAMVPVSTRTSEERNGMGNQISAMFLQLATDIEDPVERLQKIHANAQAGKAYQRAVNAKKLIEYSDFVPFGLAGQAARMYSRSHLSNLHRPIFNVVITNVPGPQVPLYLAGKRLLAHMGTAPIIDGMGLMIPIFSYNGVISISPTSADNIMPDLDVFARYLREEANTLEEAVQAWVAAQRAASGEGPAAKPVDQSARAAEVFKTLSQHLDAHPEMPLPGADIYQFRVKAEQPQQWVFDLEHSPRRIYEGESDEAACTLRMEAPHFLALAAGKLDGPAAFMQGKLKIDGDINKAIAFGKVLAAFSAARP